MLVASLGAQNVSIYAEEVPATVGTPTSIDIKVANFSGVAGAQFSVNWDSTELAYTSLSNLALGAEETSNFNLFQTGSGRLGYIIADMSLQGFELEDGTTLFTINFDIIAPDNTLAEVVFSSNPIAQVVADTLTNPLETDYQDGAILVGNVNSTFDVLQDDPRFTASPNPFTASTILRFESTSAGEALLEVYDSNGKRISSSHLDVLVGENSWPFGDAILPATGVYFLRLETESGSYGRKLVFQGR